ncbi:hypothetical protein [Microtetraspora malaysiensis]|uniref:hypothetical protein n=1 Tax=Microtetraspora malaysiensis TaxID=161358 RepID=UPI003D8AC5AB
MNDDGRGPLYGRRCRAVSFTDDQLAAGLAVTLVADNKDRLYEQIDAQKELEDKLGIRGEDADS